MLLIFSLHVPITLTKDRPSWAKLKNISPNILEITNPEIIQFFLYGDQDFIVSTNSIILKSTTEYILSTKRFDEPPFLYWSSLLITWYFFYLSIILGTYFWWHNIFNIYFFTLFFNFSLYLPFLIVCSSLVILKLDPHHPKKYVLFASLKAL